MMSYARGPAFALAITVAAPFFPAHAYEPQTSTSVATPQGADYRALLSAWLESHKRYPETARQRGEEGRAVLRFDVDRSGRVLDYAITSSSGYPDLDHSIEEMMRGATLPPFPAGMPQPRIQVSVTIHFSPPQPALPDAVTQWSNALRQHCYSGRYTPLECVQFENDDNRCLDTAEEAYTALPTVRLFMNQGNTPKVAVRAAVEMGSSYTVADAAAQMPPQATAPQLAALLMKRCLENMEIH